MNKTQFVLRLVLVVSWGVISPVASLGGSIGSGTIAGVFVDDVPTLEAPARVTNRNTFGEGFRRISQGSGTTAYNWGGDLTSRRFLDGVETSNAQIQALGLSPDDLLDRVTREFLISDNSLTFTARDFSSQPKGKTFVAGVVEYTNGSSHNGTDVPSVTLKLNTTATDPDFTQTLDVPINIFTTANVDGSPAASADFIYFADRPELGSFRVFEGESTSVEVLAEFNSLDLIGFGGVANPAVGFLSASVSAVPEPSGMIVLLGAFCAAGAGRLRRRFRG